MWNSNESRWSFCGAIIATIFANFRSYSLSTKESSFLFMLRIGTGWTFRTQTRGGCSLNVDLPLTRSWGSSHRIISIIFSVVCLYRLKADGSPQMDGCGTPWELSPHGASLDGWLRMFGNPKMVHQKK